MSDGADAGRAPLFRRIVETSRYLFVVVDGEFRVTYASPVVRDLLGYEPDELVGLPAQDLVHPDDLTTAIGALAQLVDESGGRVGVGVPLEARVRTRSGAYRHFEIGAIDQLEVPEVQGVILRLRPVEGQAHLDRALGALVAGRPIDEVLAELAAAVSAEVSPARAAVALDWDGSRFARQVSDGLPPELTGVLASDPGDPWRQAVASGDPVDRSRRVDLRPDMAAIAGSLGLAACWVFPVLVPEVAAPAAIIVWRAEEGRPWVSHQEVLHRITQLVALSIRRHEDDLALAHAAWHDGLTGVANRAQFFARLDECARHGSSAGFGVLYLDLDDFKPVNDHHGHAVGDEVLRVVSERIRACVRPGDLVARLGGDEFAVLCRGIDSVDGLSPIADRVIRSVAEPVVVDGLELRVAASVGVACTASPQSQISGDQLLDRADGALRRAKAAGKGRLHLA